MWGTEMTPDMTDRRDLLLIYAAAFLRSAGVGVMGVLLGVYLARAGLSTSSIGIVIAAGLVGTSAATALIGWKGDRLGRRKTLIIFALFTAVGGLALALTTRAAILLPLAVLGMINGTGTDRSAAFALEQAVIPGLTTAKSRTWSLSWYNVVLDGSGAMGALAAGAPAMFHARLGSRSETLTAWRSPRLPWPTWPRRCCMRACRSESKPRGHARKQRRFRSGRGGSCATWPHYSRLTLSAAAS